MIVQIIKENAQRMEFVSVMKDIKVQIVRRFNKKHQNSAQMNASIKENVIIRLDNVFVLKDTKVLIAI